MNSNTTDEASLAPYVLALTIVRRPPGSDEDEVLFCVRNRDVNLTHPDVVSVPTQRIPGSIGQELHAAGSPAGTCGDTQLLSSTRYSSSDTNGHNSMIYVVENLLARKMGMADWLERNDLEFTVELAGFHHGHARYAQGTGARPEIDDDEELKMINLLVQIDKGAENIPISTVSYLVQGWTPWSKFIDLWSSTSKDPTIIGLTPEQAIGCCVDGLCIASSFDVLSAKTN